MAKRAPAKPAKSGPSPAVLVAHGVNLDLLGRREPAVYGQSTLADVNRAVSEAAPALCQMYGLEDLSLHFFQSNDEARYLEEISGAWQGLILNPGAWTHTSLALADRLAGLGLPYVEVHISNLAKREVFRHHSYGAPHAAGVVYGFGPEGYVVALHGLIARLAQST